MHRDPSSTKVEADVQHHDDRIHTHAEDTDEEEARTRATRKLKIELRPIGRHREEAENVEESLHRKYRNSTVPVRTRSIPDARLATPSIGQVSARELGRHKSADERASQPKRRSKNHNVDHDVHIECAINFQTVQNTGKYGQMTG